MLIPAIAGAVALSGKARKWFDDDALPDWASLIMTVVFAGPFILFGAAPISEFGSDDYFALVIGLLIAVVYTDWDQIREAGASGDLSFGGAFWRGLGAGIATLIAWGIMDGDVDRLPLLGGVVFGVAGLVVQANSWWLISRALPEDNADWGQAEAVHVGGQAVAVQDSGEHYAAVAAPVAQSDSASGGLPPFAAPLSERLNDTKYQVRFRSGFARGFWSLVAFLLTGGVITCFLFALLVDRMSYSDRTGLLIGMCAFIAAEVLALSKITVRKRVGFWRESLRPFLISATLFGVGAFVTAIARNWGKIHSDDQAGLLIGLIMSSLAFVIVLALRGKLRRYEKLAPGQGAQGALASSDVAAPVPDGGFSAPDKVSV
ncbi:MAG: hypothetical protein ACPGXK_04185 [Phycisphaerae bacterium]